MRSEYITSYVLLLPTNESLCVNLDVQYAVLESWNICQTSGFWKGGVDIIINLASSSSSSWRSCLPAFVLRSVMLLSRLGFLEPVIDLVVVVFQPNLNT